MGEEARQRRHLRLATMWRKACSLPFSVIKAADGICHHLWRCISAVQDSEPTVLSSADDSRGMHLDGIFNDSALLQQFRQEFYSAHRRMVGRYRHLTNLDAESPGAYIGL